MKILFICKYIHSYTLAESRLETLIKYFKKNNYTVAAITGGSSIKELKFKKNYIRKKIANVNYYYVKDVPNYSYYSLKRIYSWIVFEYRIFNFNYNIIGFKPDVIYVSSLSLLTILNGVYLKKKFKAKLVFEMRDLWPYFLYTTGKFSKFNPFVIILDLIEKFGIYHSNLIIGLIPKINEYIKYRGFIGKKTFSSTFPLIERFFKKKNFFKITKSKEVFDICYAGNFGYDNYVDILLDLISNTKDRCFIFHLIGTGSQKLFLEKKFSYLDNVKFYEHVNYDDLHSILIKMDLLIVSFGFNNKYPLFGYELNKLNNYMMACKPIIVVGSKKNLLESRGKFTFITKNNSVVFKKKLLLIKKNYRDFLNIAKLNKKKLLKRNNPNLIFKETIQQLKYLK
jgi:hypothetical protein